MPDTATIDTALDRLNAALDKLTSAVERRHAGDRASEELERELERLGEDRSRLATELDDSALRASRLEDANREVSRRLVAAMETIRAVLDNHGG